MLSAVEADLPDNTAQTDDSDGTEEVAFANAAVADIRAPSLRLEIRTKGPCWVSAVADGERVIYRLMQPGERTLVEARARLRSVSATQVPSPIRSMAQPADHSAETARRSRSASPMTTLEVCTRSLRVPIPPKVRPHESGEGLAATLEANGQRAVAA